MRPQTFNQSDGTTKGNQSYEDINSNKSDEGIQACNQFDEGKNL